MKRKVFEMKIFCIIAALFCFLTVNAGEIEDWERKLSEAERLVRTNPKPWYDIFFDTKIKADRRLKEYIKKRDEIKSKLDTLKKQRRVVVSITLEYEADNPSWWSETEGKPDIYLKKDGVMITSVYSGMKQGNSTGRITINNLNISFSCENPAEIEVWDKDIKDDDFIFTIKLDGRGSSPMTGQSRGLKYTVEWI